MSTDEVTLGWPRSYATIDRYCCDPKICIVHFFLFYSVMARAYIYYPIVIGTYVNSIVIYSVLIFNIILKLQAPQVMRAYIIILYLYTWLRELCVFNLRLQMKKRSMMRGGDHIYSRNYRRRRQQSAEAYKLYFFN